VSNPREGEPYVTRPFAGYDARHYPTLSVVEGYRRWAPSYERSMDDELDYALLLRLRSVDWRQQHRAADLACGTGRTGRWLRARGVSWIDGVDLTDGMLAAARSSGIYARTVQADMRETTLPAAAYDLVISVLAVEHLPALSPLYTEAARLARPAGCFVLLGYHPFFLLNGIPTHFEGDDGPVAIENYVHLFSDHAGAAHAAGWRLVEMAERVVDAPWAEKQPGFAKHLGRPVSFALVWRLEGIVPL
jgi:SAM-dependent methyltransferase